MKFFPGDQESSFAFFSLSCVWSTCPLLATAWSCARRHAAAQPGPLVRLQGALRTVSRLLDSEKPGGLGKSPRGALSLSVKSIAHGLPIRHAFSRVAGVSLAGGATQRTLMVLRTRAVR